MNTKSFEKVFGKVHLTMSVFSEISTWSTVKTRLKCAVFLVNDISDSEFPEMTLKLSPFYLTCASVSIEEVDFGTIVEIWLLFIMQGVKMFSSQRHSVLVRSALSN
jgi:hypothetical protein